MKRIKELRTAKKLTQAELAKQLQVTQQTVAQWEKGKSMPNDSKLAELAAALDTTVAHLTEADSKIDLSKVKQRNSLKKTTEISTDVPLQSSDTSDLIKAIQQHMADFKEKQKNKGEVQFMGLQLKVNAPFLWFPISKEAQSDFIDELYENNFTKKFFKLETLNNKTLFINKEQIIQIKLDHYSIPSEHSERWDGFCGFSSETLYRDFLNLFWKNSELESDLMEVGDCLSFPNLDKNEREEMLSTMRNTFVNKTNNSEFITAFDNIFSKVGGYWDTFLDFFSVRVHTQNEVISGDYYDVGAYHAHVLQQQLMQTRENSWLDLYNDHSDCTYEFIKASECTLIEIPTTLLEDGLQEAQDN